ncbi:hypothetical protein LR48_Vigan04g035500 [Vigna angularis]|uniref:Uncharacterized protein n=1 Tax=Phaseolus angularis TaxID=3914 RepID=A0A0L9UC75_PHAAN|nr:hypothetical protein LR48_Vigan04g035500 [Vigna angularis]
MATQEQKIFAYETLASVTKNFSDIHKLGEGVLTTAGIDYQKDNHANPYLQTLTPLLDEARRNPATTADLELVLEGGDHD